MTPSSAGKVDEKFTKELEEFKKFLATDDGKAWLTKALTDACENAQKVSDELREAMKVNPLSLFEPMMARAEAGKTGRPPIYTSQTSMPPPRT